MIIEISPISWVKKVIVVFSLVSAVIAIINLIVIIIFIMAPRQPTRPYRSKHFGNTKHRSISRSSGYFLGDVFLSFIIIIKDKSIWDNIRTAFCKFYPKIFKIFFRMVIFASDNYSGIYSSNR